ncbi:unnamed protein product [Boreogadus saida]
MLFTLFLPQTERSAKVVDPQQVKRRGDDVMSLWTTLKLRFVEWKKHRIQQKGLNDRTWTQSPPQAVASNIGSQGSLVDVVDVLCHSPCKTVWADQAHCNVTSSKS